MQTTEPGSNPAIRLLREPLLHFLVLGAIIFALYAVFSGGDDAPGESDIVVSAGKIEHLAALFSRTWQRPPTRQELQGLIDDYIREEAAYREGMALGLDTDDTVIRRRIRQKLDFIAEDLAALAQPTEADLQAYLEANPDDFRQSPILSFRHIYLNPQGRENLADDARDLLITLNGDPTIDTSALGDRILLEHAYEDASTRDIAALFGLEFAEQLTKIQPSQDPTEQWHGPLRSGYGAHLVRIDRRVPGRLPPLEEIHGAVLREWENERRLAAIDRYYNEMVSRYDVSIEWPPDIAPDEPSAP